MIDNDEAIDVAQAMDKHGGGFVQTLARLIYKADPINKAKIKATWPEYWEQYKKVAEDEKSKKINQN